MKKTIFTICAMLLAGMLAVSLTSCTNTSLEEETPQTVSKLVFKGKLSYGSDIDTKAVKTGWKSGDKVYAFFKSGDNFVNPTLYVQFTYTGGDPVWEATPSSALEDLGILGTNGTMYVVYFPFGNIDIASDGSTGVTFTSGGVPVYSYYLSGNARYDITTSGETAILDSTIDMEIPSGFVYFFVDKSGSDFNADGTYFLTVDGFQPVACTGFSEGSFSETSGTVGDPVWGYAYDNAGIAFSGKIDNSWDGTASHNIILYTGAEPYPLKYMIQTAALTSHASVNLKNGWKECGFHDHIVSPGLLKSDGTLTAGTDPFGDVSDANEITYPESLPDGWYVPTRAQWTEAISGARAVPVKVFNNDGTLNSTATSSVASNPYAYVKYSDGTNNEKTGLLLIRDGARIDNYDITYGTTSSVNTLTTAQINKLLTQGCLIIASDDPYDEGRTYFTSEKPNSQKHYYLHVYATSHKMNESDKKKHWMHLFR